MMLTLRSISYAVVLALLLSMVGLAPPQAHADEPPTTLGYQRLIGHSLGRSEVAFPGDMTGSGYEDMVVVEPSGYLYQWQFTSNSRYTKTRLGSSQWGSMRQIGGADFDGNGHADVVAERSSGSIRLYSTNSKGRLVSPSLELIAPGAGLRTWTVVDAGPNGRPAIFAIDARDRLVYYPWDGDRLGGKQVVESGYGRIASLHDANDMDRDGRSELLAIGTGGWLSLYQEPEHGMTPRVTLGKGFLYTDDVAVVAAAGSSLHLRGRLAGGGLYDWTVTSAGTQAWGMPPRGDYGGSHGRNARPGTNGIVPAKDLCVIPFQPTHLLRCGTISDVIRLHYAFKARFGRNLPIDRWRYSTFRSYADQQVVWREIGPPIAARPGTSPHGYGLAIDWGEDGGFTSTVNRWLAANGPRYNWVRQPWHEEGGSWGEWWHFDYIG